MIKRKLFLAAVLGVAAILIANVLALLQSTRTIYSSGTISGVNLGVYADSGYTTQLTSIAWGTLSNGTSTNQTIYVRNDGKAMNMTLSMTTESWSPADATDYLTLTWDKENSVLAPGSGVAANLTLSILPSFTNGTDFSVNIKITGTEQT